MLDSLLVYLDYENFSFYICFCISLKTICSLVPFDISDNLSSFSPSWMTPSPGWFVDESLLTTKLRRSFYLLLTDGLAIRVLLLLWAVSWTTCYTETGTMMGVGFLGRSVKPKLSKKESLFKFGISDILFLRRFPDYNVEWAVGAIDICRPFLSKALSTSWADILQSVQSDWVWTWDCLFWRD